MMLRLCYCPAIRDRRSAANSLRAVHPTRQCLNCRGAGTASAPTPTPAPLRRRPRSRMKITSTWPSQLLCQRPQATRLTDTPCSIISAHKNMTIMFRRLRKPTRPMANSAAPDQQRIVQQVRLRSSGGLLIIGDSSPWNLPCANSDGRDRRRMPSIRRFCTLTMAVAPTSATNSSVPATSTAIRCRPNNSPPKSGHVIGRKHVFVSSVAVAGRTRRLVETQLADGHRQNSNQHRARRLRPA